MTFHSCDPQVGSCTITAIEANRASVTCEFITQALEAEFRKPTGEWHHAAVDAFAASTPPEGHTALAVQFVKSATDT